MDHACDRPPVDHQRGRNGPARIARDEGAGAVDRIDDDEHAACETLGVVGRLLRQPSRFGKRLAEPPLETARWRRDRPRSRESRRPSFRFAPRSPPRAERTRARAAPASRAASARQSRAARALLSASTFNAMSGARASFGVVALAARAPLRNREGAMGALWARYGPGGKSASAIEAHSSSSEALQTGLPARRYQ